MDLIVLDSEDGFIVWDTLKKVKIKRFKTKKEAQDFIRNVDTIRTNRV